jgi:hypothetical protein
MVGVRRSDELCVYRVVDIDDTEFTTRLEHTLGSDRSMWLLAPAMDASPTDTKQANGGDSPAASRSVSPPDGASVDESDRWANVRGHRVFMLDIIL